MTTINEFKFIELSLYNYKKVSFKLKSENNTFLSALL